MRTLALLAAGLALAAAPVAADTGAYSFSPTAVEGSARAVGTGGSILASPKDYTAVFVNPAGLAGLPGSGDGVDFGSDSNNIDNFVVDPSNNNAKALNDPLKYAFYGFRYVTVNGWGFGFAEQEPYELDDKFSGTTKLGRRQTPVAGKDQTEITAKSHVYTLSAAKAYWDKTLAVGVGIDYVQVSESYDFTPVLATTAPLHQAATNDAFAAAAGVIYSPRTWLQAALVYKMGWRVPFDNSRNGLGQTTGTTGAVTAFRDAKTPDKVSVGVRWAPNRYFSLMAQSNYTFAMRNTLVVGSDLFPGGANVLSVGQYESLDGHWGFEFIPIDEPDLTFKLWAGGYLEDTQLQGSFTRYHRTAGFALEPWAVDLSMAIDDTNLYNNFVVGVGVDMLEAAQRVCKRFNCTLPL